MKISEIMTPPTDIIDPNTMVPDAAARMGAESVDVLPVGEDDRVLGTVSNRDIGARMIAEDRAPEETPVRHVMSRWRVYCFEDDPVQQAVAVMAKHRIRQLPVLNRNKQVVGMVMFEVAEARASRASEIVENLARGISPPTD